VREFGSAKAVGIWEKSPVRIAAVSVVANVAVVRRELYPSKLDMKNSRFFPLNSLGIRTGPPSVKPY
jgi:hypothetical protein